MKRAVIFMCMRRVFLILPRPLWRSFVSLLLLAGRETKRRERQQREDFSNFYFHNSKPLAATESEPSEKRGLCMNAFCAVYMRKQS
jgi:hypothetical protein